MERLIAAQRYYRDFFVWERGLDFLTFDSMGWEITPVDVQVIHAQIGGASPHEIALTRGCFDFKIFYPGDAYVDWVSLDWYMENRNIPTEEGLEEFGATMMDVVSVAHNKPVLMMELGFADGLNRSSRFAEERVVDGLNELLQYPQVNGFAMWVDSFDPIGFPTHALIRPNTHQGNAFKRVVESNPSRFHSCIYYSYGIVHPHCR